MPDEAYLQMKLTQLRSDVEKLENEILEAYKWDKKQQDELLAKIEEAKPIIEQMNSNAKEYKDLKKLVDGLSVTIEELHAKQLEFTNKKILVVGKMMQKTNEENILWLKGQLEVINKNLSEQNDNHTVGLMGFMESLIVQFKEQGFKVDFDRLLLDFAKNCKLKKDERKIVDKLSGALSGEVGKLSEKEKEQLGYLKKVMESM